MDMAMNRRSTKGFTIPDTSCVPFLTPKKITELSAEHIIIGCVHEKGMCLFVYRLRGN
jgi:hypothetical protein